MAFSVPASKNFDIINTVEDEKFVQIFTSDNEAVQLTNNGRSIVSVKREIFAAALGVHLYSSGIHRIRTRIDKGYPFLGIRSHSIPPGIGPPLGDICISTPSTYGWESQFRYINGRAYQNHWKIAARTDNVWTITLNCDKHRLHLIDENTNDEDEIEVDINHAPLPWRFFIGLSRITGGISLI